MATLPSIILIMIMSSNEFTPFMLGVVAEPPPTTAVTEPEITPPDISTVVLKKPFNVVIIQCIVGGKLMQGFVADSFYFDGKDMRSVNCKPSGLVPDEPFETDGMHMVESDGEEVVTCKPGSGVRVIILYIEEDNTLQSFKLACDKLKEDLVAPGDTSTTTNAKDSLTCESDSVVSGLGAKRDGKEYIVTAVCQKLKSAKTETAVPAGLPAG